MSRTDAVAIVSGGMDSAVLAYDLAGTYQRLHLLSFDYGQRHRKELEHAKDLAAFIGARWSLIDLRSVGALLAGSSLTDPAVEVPEGHYEAPTMKLTVVPNRNAMMLAVAYAVAVAEGAKVVGCGVHAGDHAVYPDCRPEFVAAFGAMQLRAVEGFGDPSLRLFAPFVHLTKADIARKGARLGVPFERTWSCYKGGALHCGRCGTCVERREAFALAGVPDPTEYEPG